MPGVQTCALPICFPVTILATQNELGLQIGRQTAELALMQAQTKKTEAEAEKIAGADTANTIADTAIKQATAEIQAVAARVANATEKQQIDQITYAANEQIQRAREQFNKTQVSEETQRDAINKIKQEAIGVGIENILKEAQVGKTRTETNAIIEGVRQKWDAINKIKKEAIGVGIENILKEAQVGKTRSETNAIIES